MTRADRLLLLVLLAVQLPWLGRPVDLDETNFLALAHGAAVDAWRPHDVSINWQGTTERAFDVLSNPPGIGWWLAPVVDAPVAVQRAWMLPWLLLAAWGARRLAERFTPEGDPAGAALLLASPIVVLSTTALLPDAPLYALTLAGVAGFVGAVDARRPALGWAMLAGGAALFRYSGMALAPLLGLYAILRGRPPWAALAAWAPLAALGLHDLDAYGEWHLAAMGRFQSVANTPGDVAHKLVAALAMLGGAAALPVFRWGLAAGVGAGIGALAGLPWGGSGAAFGALGGAALLAAISAALPGADRATEDPAAGGPARRHDGWWLAAWAAGGFVFLGTLRFVATRYWLPFLPGVLLALPRGPRSGAVAVAVSLALGIGLLADADAQARGARALAERVAALGTGTFTGHWGWQHALEARGWVALDEDTRPPHDALVAMPRQAWPQPVDVSCREVVWVGDAPPEHPWLPRGYTEAGRANLHANWIAGPPMTRTVAPWGFASDPYESARVCRE